MTSLASPHAARKLALRRVLRTQQKESHKLQVKADINITPLVDVVLVVLIIFMVVTPLIASGVPVELPRTAHHALKPDDGRDIIISITHDDRVFIGPRATSLADLGRQIRDEQRKFPNKTVFLKGDLRARFGTMRQAMQTLRAGGVSDVVMGTEQLGKR